MTLTEPQAHDLTLHSTKPTKRTDMATRFWGECSCGERSGKCTTAGMVHGWHADHVNRFPKLTSAIVVASAGASAEASRGNMVVARSYLSDARKLAQELRRMAPDPLREAETLALSLYERAQRDVAQAEGRGEVPG